MTDGYDVPRWNDEPRELDENEAPSVVDHVDVASRTAEPDIEASSENVLDGWPASTPTVDPAGEAYGSASDVAVAAVDDDAPGDAAVAPSAGGAEEQIAGPVLSDHVSATMEHAPGELTVPPGYAVLEGQLTGDRRAVGIVVARFNGDVTTALLESALAELEARGVSRDAVTVMPVPGAFELPLAAMALAKTRRFACIVALGCVIRGDTPHFDYVSAEAASGLQLAAIETGVPVAFGVLTLDRADQAEARYDKGAEAVRTGLEMADLFANLRAAAAR